MSAPDSIAGRPLPHALDVYVDGMLAGVLARASGGRMKFTYATKHSPRLSVSLPVRSDTWPPANAQPFFAGLLPDESLWSTIGLRLGRGNAGPYDLLALLGRDVAGAVQLVGTDQSLAPSIQRQPSDDDPGVTWLDTEQLAVELTALARAPLGISATRRFSLAGAQEKLLVLRAPNGSFAVPDDGRPSTHILKPDAQRFPGSASSEAFCMELARRCALEAAPVELIAVGDVPVACVTRFDRRVREGVIHRVHQEDFCQALGVMPQDRYEDQGGPTLVDALHLIGAYCRRAARDRLEFLRRSIFHWLVGNTDAHGKNHALLHAGGTAQLAPMYDVLCVEAFIQSGALAMSIADEFDPRALTRAHWEELLRRAGIGPRTIDLLQRFAQTVEATCDALAHESSWRDRPDTTRPVLERVHARARRLCG